VDSFNENMENAFQPDIFLVVDEIMSSWKGLESLYSVDGSPHLTKIARKPEGVGAECKAIACGESKILVMIEPLEGKDIMKNKPFQQEFGAGTATSLRLNQAYHGSSRTVIAECFLIGDYIGKISSYRIIFYG
jgi:Transposase IS4